MGKIVANFFISLDGVVESPDQWHFPWFDDEMGAVVSAGAETAGAFLMGRTLYEEWAAYWPTSTDEPFATFFNTIPKYVVSDTLSDPGWTNTTAVRRDPAAVRAIKDEVDGDVQMSGSATTVRWLLDHELLDELKLLVHPVVVGSGRRLFEDAGQHRLRLLRCAALSSGVLDLTYAGRV